MLQIFNLLQCKTDFEACIENVGTALSIRGFVIWPCERPFIIEVLFFISIQCVDFFLSKNSAHMCGLYINLDYDIP